MTATDTTQPEEPQGRHAFVTLPGDNVCQTCGRFFENGNHLPIVTIGGVGGSGSGVSVVGGPGGQGGTGQSGFSAVGGTGGRGGIGGSGRAATWHTYQASISSDNCLICGLSLREGIHYQTGGNVTSDPVAEQATIDTLIQRGLWPNPNQYDGGVAMSLEPSPDETLSEGLADLCRRLQSGIRRRDNELAEKRRRSAKLAEQSATFETALRWIRDNTEVATTTRKMLDYVLDGTNPS